MVSLQENDSHTNSNPKLLMHAMNRIKYPSDKTMDELLQGEIKSKKISELEYYSHNLEPKIPFKISNVDDKTNYNDNNDLTKTLTAFFNIDGDENFYSKVNFTPALSECMAEDSNFIDNFFTI